MADPKQIKFQFVVDEAAAQKARQLIRDITSDLTRLSEAAGKANIGGASGVGMKVGSGNVSSAENAKVIAKTAPQGRQIVQGLLDQKGIFKGIGDGAKDALRAMDEGVKSSVSKQKQELESLERSVKKLRGAYSELQFQTSKASSPLEKEFLQGRQDRFEKEYLAPNERRMRNARWNHDVQDPERADELRKIYGETGSSYGIKEMEQEIKAEKAAGGGGGGILSKLLGGGGAGGGGGGAGAAGGILRQLGINPSMIARGGLAAVGVGGLKAIDNELMNNSNRQSDYAAYRGQMFAPEISQSYHGDIRNTMALDAIMRDSEMKKDYKEQDTGWKRFRYGVGGVLSGIKNLDAHEIGMGLTGQTGANTIIENRQKMVQNQRASDPLRDELLGEITGNYKGRMGAMRALGIGDVTNTNKLQPGDRVHAGFQRMDQALTKAGYDVGEGAAAMGQIEAGGTRKAGHQLMFSALNAQAGGLRGAAGYAGTMSRFGGGANFLSAAQVMGGQQTDVAVADTMAQFAANQASGFNMNTGPGTGLGTLGMLGTGVGKGEDSRMIAEQNMKGFGGLQKIMSGGTDAYQSARNLQIAMGAAPGAGVYGQDYLANKMDLGNMADIMSGATGVSGIAKSLGVTKGMVENQFKGVTASTMERIISDPNMAGTSMAKTMGAMQESGKDPRAWFKEQSKKKGFKKDDALNDYAAFLLMSGQASDEAGAMGLARTMTGMGTKASTKGKKVGDVAGKSLEGAQAESQAEQMDKKINLLESEAGKLTGQVKIQAEATAKLASLSQQQAATQEQVIEAMERYSVAMDMIASGQAKTTRDAFDMADKTIAKRKAGEKKAYADKLVAEALKKTGGVRY